VEHASAVIEAAGLSRRGKERDEDPRALVPAIRIESAAGTERAGDVLCQAHLVLAHGGGDTATKVVRYFEKVTVSHPGSASYRLCLCRLERAHRAGL